MRLELEAEMVSWPSVYEMFARFGGLCAGVSGTGGASGTVVGVETGRGAGAGCDGFLD